MKLENVIPIKELEEAMRKDFEQQAVDSLTPDLGYGFPADNVRALILKHCKTVKFTE